MKATTYDRSPRGQKTARCDTQLGVTDVTARPKRVKLPLKLITRGIYRDVTATDGVTNPNLLGVTVSRNGYVTATVSLNGEYAKRLIMTKKIVRTIWLTIERIAELKGCSVRTAWRYIEQHKLETHKHLVETGCRKVLKTFVMTDLHLYSIEIEDCSTKSVVPDILFETSIGIAGKSVNSALILNYRKVIQDVTATGGKHESL